MADEAFYNNFNLACTLLNPKERKAINLVLRTCDDYGVPFTEALRLTESDPWSLPQPVYWAVQKADRLGVFERITSFFLEPES